VSALFQKGIRILSLGNEGRKSFVLLTPAAFNILLITNSLMILLRGIKSQVKNNKIHKMQYLIMTLSTFALVSCGSGEETADPTGSVLEQTEEKLEEIQADNVDIEKLDGQLDSLINEIE